METRREDADGKEHRVVITHRGVFTGGFFDSPERQAQAQWPGIATRLFCGYCLFQGTLVGRFPYPMGYSQPAPQPNSSTGGEPELHANDKQLQISALCAAR